MATLEHRRTTTPRPSAHLAWMDNLRVAIIVGMIGTHVGAAYIVDIGWYYEERSAGPAAVILMWIVIGIGALFGMGLLFLVAGLLSSPSLQRKGPLRFAVDRLIRLGIPLAFVLLIGDGLADYLGYRGEGGDADFTTWFRIWVRYDWDFGPMWFVAVLLVLSLGYAGWRSWRPAPAVPGRPLRMRQLVLVAALIAVTTYAIRLVWPFLSDAVFGLNLWEFPQMAVMFALGVLAGERGWFGARLPDRTWHLCGWAAVGGALLLAATMVTFGPDERFTGGWRIEALALPLVEGIIAVGMSLWMMEWFRRRWDSTGRLREALGRSSYAAFVVHPPVLVILSIMLRSVPVSGEVKFLIVFPLGAAASFAVGWLLTKWRVTARVI